MRERKKEGGKQGWKERREGECEGKEEERSE